jgi:hypothetical protein
MQKQPFLHPSLGRLGRLRGASDGTNEIAPAQVVGTTTLYENGKIKLIPAPTPDPKGEPLLWKESTKFQNLIYLQIP